MTRFFAAWVTQAAVGCAVAPCRSVCSITAKTYNRAPDKVTVPKKSHPRRTSAWERRKSDQVLDARSGAGGTPAS
ncbi:hypothetical protein [Streptomyces mirabilis]|uniref:Uncharacterized protein n=1 Tax=Streptomyces mirabilis TaxID=68239 RepID=A0A1I2L2Y0_9ACTN|nr:hypothetical protein [Streptomyces mirabilis]SFF71486.1 hypothetical protein SAMN02787118_11140 [Streptomyces mirabilis]